MSLERTATAPLDVLSAAGATDTGRQREHNEDRYHLDPVNGIFLVVDGVGGGAAGEVAAQIAVQTIVTRLARRDGPTLTRIREAITLANQDIYRHARQEPGRRGMACVLTLAVMDGRRLSIGHVGDSRLYKLTRQGIAKLTHDHSPVGEREDAREISETDAMQHARRNEVYRDVGSEPREPDAPDFIETAESTLDDDEAILLCSDGLSDMLTSIEIDRTARRYAGDPQLVVEALIGAANDAGGRDNITVIFVEGPAFARQARAGGGAVWPPAPRAEVSTMPLAALQPPAPPIVEGDAAGRRAGSKPGLLRRIIQSRVLALMAGILIGLAGTLALALRDTPLLPAATGPRRLVVGTSAASTYQTIGEALREARAGDVVQVEPGEYAEAVLLPNGVELTARVPGKAVLVAPAGGATWVPVTASAGRSIIRGFRIEGRPGAPVLAGVVAFGGDIEIDDMTFEGTIGVAVEIRGNGGAVVLRSSRFNVVGLPLRIGDAASPLVQQNVFIAGADRRTPAVDVAAAATPRLDGNVFVRFPQAVAPPARRDALLTGNYVFPAGPRR
jgi:serine/threonine protein phosphatase PrpC